MKLSFRSQIAVLGVLVLVALAAAAGVFVSILQHTETALVSQGVTRLADVSHALAREYSERSHAAARSGDAFTLVTEVVLSRERGVEGGYYDPSTDDVVGYAFPTHEGPQPKRDVPPAERTTILEVARQAARTGIDAERTLVGRSDIIMFHATAVRDSGATSGSAWVMTRLPNPRAQADSLASSVGALIAVVMLVCVVLAFFVARSLQQGVARMERGVAALEHDPDSRLAIRGEHAELARIGAAVNRLADVLRINRARERQIEERLRHAERLAALGRVAAGIAHEVRNPLATMRLRAQMIGRAAPPDAPPERGGAATRSVAMIVEEIDRLDALAGRLLTFAKPVAVSRVPTDIGALVSHRLEAYSARADLLGVVFDIVLPNSIAMVNCDPSQLAQVFDNLIQNALDAMDPAGGPLRVRARRSGAGETDSIIIEITDTGVGMSAEQLARVGEPFFTTKAGGTGLGLAISSEFVRGHGGELTMKSEPGIGTVAVVTLAVAGDRPVPTGAQ